MAMVSGVLLVACKAFWCAVAVVAVMVALAVACLRVGCALRQIVRVLR